jgi:ubiquitin carboxyl-terminal hydrolase L3
MTPDERSKFLESTQLVADIHAEAASSGQSAVPTNLDTNLHFTCFVHAPSLSRRETHDMTKSMRLIELDGRRAGPIDRGECSDLLQARMLDLGRSLNGISHLQRPVV